MSAKEHGGGGRVGAGGRQGRRASGAIRRRSLEVLQAAARWSGRAGGGLHLRQVLLERREGTNGEEGEMIRLGVMRAIRR
jgi:hypothetical protein